MYIAVVHRYLYFNAFSNDSLLYIITNFKQANCVEVFFRAYEYDLYGILR
jgi:hypothetical protein